MVDAEDGPHGLGLALALVAGRLGVAHAALKVEQLLLDHLPTRRRAF